MVTFVATFCGVILSFMLWFGGLKLIELQRNKKAAANMLKDTREEMILNIAKLDEFVRTTTPMLEEGNIPHFIPNRLNVEVYRYLVASGDIRLLSNIKDQRLIRYSGDICEGFNKFIDNTERLLAVFLLRPDGLKWSVYRLERIIDQAKATRGYLQDNLNKLQRGEVSKEGTTTPGA